MINHNARLIFVHINKCAGQTIRRALPKGTRGHHTIQHYLGVCTSEGRDPREYFKFTFVRNPWDKVVSFYHYHQERGWDIFPWKSKNAPEFKPFVRRMFEEDGGALAVDIFRGRSGDTTHHLRLSSSMDWISDQDGAMLVDFIGRFENLQGDFDEVCRRAKLPQKQLPHANRSKRGTYQTYYDSQTAEIVARRFQRDLTHLGYTFE